MSLPSRPVAYYVHHHGSGHANRTKLLAARWPVDVSVHVFTTAVHEFSDWRRGTVHPLPVDTSPDRDPAQDMQQNQVLHYAPVDLPPVSQRMAVIANWIAEHRPSRFIVDLSVEVALLVRLCGAEVHLVRLHGHRDDPAHLAAFGLAHRLIAPFPRELEDAHTPTWVRGKTDYLGAFSRYDDRTESKLDCRRQLDLSPARRVATVINGSGGGAQVPSHWGAVARANPEWTFLLVGQVPSATPNAPNLRRVGRVEDTFPYLKAADVVIGSGGTNTMMEIGAARVPYLSLPEPRPFDEQLCKMQALEKLGLTEIVGSAPSPSGWGALLERARGMQVEGWGRLFQPGLDVGC